VKQFSSQVKKRPRLDKQGRKINSEKNGIDRLKATSPAFLNYLNNKQFPAY